MEARQRSISGTLHMKIIDDGETEHTTTHYSGEFYHRNNMDVITFLEKNEHDLSIKNLITIQDDKVSIKRTGDVSMYQQFRKNQTTENVLKHPHVTIHMETFTHKFGYQPPSSENAGELSIAFTVKLNGQEERQQQLTLLMKEDS